MRYNSSIKTASKMKIKIGLGENKAVHNAVPLPSTFPLTNTPFHPPIGKWMHSTEQNSGIYLKG